HQPMSFPNLPPRVEGEYLTDREADEAVAFIRRNREKPFFLSLFHYAVHAPIQAKADLIEHYDAKPRPEHDGQIHAKYAAMVHSMDEATGRILKTLDDLGLRENTLVLFTSDNGGATHFPATDNRPLRSGKGRPYEGGLRVPFIVNWPGRIKAGAVIDTPVNSIDLLPTICHALDVDRPSAHVIDGLDLMPLMIQGQPLSRETMYWHYPHYWWGGRVTPYSVIRHGSTKLIRWYESGEFELYDLANDPSETTNLATSNPDIVADLSARLDVWLQDTGALMPRQNPSYGKPD
ncbi:MAG: sulfatase-like hydrolase/transferase, partial [Planctomycetota bacterium]|nr:sulfatase-like hydrolase/transferase [Planctomycetota bacterium]